ncbi:MAG: bifunctional 5,10-methylene-tetrahydrofolate dehydrogenase/5,10-methylene-tetrahydrofolate cyclohydrolase [Alloprevotella sp.]|nr:bifunctional 5,10-methylene-tetrahydrofolate dehydrogenase/5,10-methylene-tetrahydrofolate cyclohydrolase [Alloprevotella sp.]
MQILDGKITAEKIRHEIADEVQKMVSAGLRRPHLAAILVGHDGGSLTYVNNKVKACHDCGFESTLLHFGTGITEKELIDEVKKLNDNPEIDGFIVQLPLPHHISERRVIEAIDYRKDVDGFHPVNTGRLNAGLPCFVSATPRGILELLRRYDVRTRSKRVVILGRSNIVGKPLASMLMQRSYGDATVTVCHSHTLNIADECRRADILIAAIGQPEFVTADMVREGATVIDVGTTRVPDASCARGYRLAGDVKFDEVAPKCAYITPVPGGVGPMTIAMLMQNTLAAARKEYYH